MKKSFSNILVVVFLVFLFFIPPLIKGKIPMPADSILNLYHPFRDLELDGYNKGKFPAKNPFINDPVLQTYEWRKLVVDNIKAGSAPLWNPYSFSGQPLLANFQSATFQILNVFLLFLPFNIGWAAVVIIPQVMLSVFMYLFLKELKISKVASVFGAIVLPFTGFFMPWLTWGTIVTTAMWLPLILLLIIKLQSELSPSVFLLLVGASVSTILSGHAQTALYVFFASSLFTVFQYFKNRNLKTVLITASALTLGTISSAVQTVPFLEFVRLSARGSDQGYFSGRQDWFLPVHNLVQLIAPDFFGNPATNNYSGVWNWWEFVSFIGIIPLSFAIYAIFKKSQNKSFFISLSAIALLFALPNPISKLPYLANIPMVSTMQPSRIIFLFVFAAVCLSAIGLDRYLKENRDKFIFIPIAFLIFICLLAGSTMFLKEDVSQVALRNLIIPTATVLILIFISLVRIFKNKPKLIIFLIYTFTIAELFRFTYKFTPFSKLSWIFPQTQITKYLQQQPKPFRIMTTDRQVMHPDISGAYKLESVDGYDPLYLDSYARLVSAWQGNDPMLKTPSYNRIVTPQNTSSPIRNLLNVKYVLTLSEINDPEFVKVMEEGETKLYSNTKAQPRAFFVNEVKREDSGPGELKNLQNVNFEKNSATSQEFEFQKQTVNASSNIKSYSDQALTIETSSDKLSPLVVTNPYYPGWNAYIDGEKSEVKKVDFMFLSTMVPAGTHTVEFKFEPRSFYNGLMISATGIIAAALMSVLLWKKKFQ